MKRLYFIDSLRGIASLFVVLFHLIDPIFSNIHISLSETYLENIKIVARCIFNGSDWVSFFFVLSGFSLSLSYLKNKEEINLKSFILKRIFRIYPLYLVVLFVSFILFNNGTSVISLLSQSLLFNFKNDLVITSWSLSVELIGSLLMPLFIIVYRNNKKTFYYLTIISFLFYNGIGMSQNAFFGFTVNFLMGIILSHFYSENKIEIPKKIKYYLIPFIIFSFSFRWFIDFFPKIKYIIKDFTDFMNMDFHQFFYFISSIGSFALIYMTLSSLKSQLFLSNRILIYIGKISFSIYLTHFLIIKLFYIKILGLFVLVNNEYLIVFISVFVLLLFVILISSLTYFLIEKPFIDLSNKIINRKLK